jgi:hypothetical protein
MEVKTDIFFESFFEQIPKHLKGSFSDQQLSAIKLAFGGRAWGQHFVEIRRSIPFFKSRFYLVFLAGPEGRNIERLRMERGARRFWTLPNTAVIGLFFLILVGAISSSFYTVDQIFSFNIFPQPISKAVGPEPWQSISLDQSSIRFKNKSFVPEIRHIEKRALNLSVNEENLLFNTDFQITTSHMFLQTAGPGKALSMGSGSLIDQMTILEDKAKQLFVGAASYDLKSGKNDRGEFNFVVANYSDRLKCVYSQQGVRDPSNTENSGSSVFYRAVLEFTFCARQSDQNIIEYFNNMKLKNSSSRK